MADGTAWRLVSRCTTVEEVVRGFRALATVDGLEDIPVSGGGPAGGSHVRVVLALASKAAVLDGDAVVTVGDGTLGVRFLRLDVRGKALLAHMIEHRAADVMPAIPRHLIPLGTTAGTPARADLSPACTLESMAGSGPALRPSIPDLAATVRQAGARRDPAPPTLRDSKPPSMTSVPGPGAVPMPERPKREAQKTLMGMPTLSGVPGVSRTKAPSTPPPPATLPASSNPALVVAAGTPTGVPTERVGAETGPTRPTRGPTEPSPVIKLAAQALSASGPLGSVPNAFESVPTVPTPVPNIRAMVPSRVDSAPSGPVDDLPTVPNDDIQTDVAVSLPDLPPGEDVDPVVDPPPPLVAPKSIPVFTAPVPVAPPPVAAPYYPPAPTPAPPPVQVQAAYYPPPQPAPPRPMYPPTAQLPVLQPGQQYAWHSSVPQGVERDEDMTEMVALVRPPRRRWPVIAVTSGVIVIGVAVMVYVAASSKTDGDHAAHAPAPAPAPAPGPGPGPGPADIHTPGPGPGPGPAPVPVPVAAGTCKVAFTSSPDAAEIVIDGQVVGVTPMEHEVPCAGAKVTFRRAKYQPQVHTVAPGDTTAEVRLERPGFKVKVTSRPPGATVKVGGAAVGKTPIVITLPGYETTSIELTRNGYGVTTQRVYAGKSGQKVDVKLKPRRR